MSKNTVGKYVAEPLTFARSADIFRWCKRAVRSRRFTDWDITEAGILSALGNFQVFPPGKASFPPQTSSFKSVDVNDLPKCLWGCGRFFGP